MIKFNAIVNNFEERFVGGVLNVVSGTVVHPELLHGDAQRDDVEQGSDPTVQCVL